MRQVTASVFAIFVALAAVVGPIAASLYLANRQSLQAETEQALELANEVLRRSEEIGDQAGTAIVRLTQSDTMNPCSDAQIARMRSIDLSSSYLQMVGYVSNDRLMCSSLGRHRDGIPLGPADYVSRRGATVRSSVQLSIAPGMQFFVTEKYGYAAILHREFPIDVLVEKRDVSLGVFGVSTGRVLVNRGVVKSSWIAALGSATQTKFYDGEHVVVVRRSAQYDVAAFAAVPAIHVNQRMREFALVLVPLGFLIGIGLLAAFLYLARQQASLPAALRTALKRNEFCMLYQPIVELRTRRWVGSEALIRWRRHDGSFVRPDAFIPAAEESGLIERITARVMDMVNHDMRGLLRAHSDFYVGINVSSADLQSGDIFKRVKALIDSAGIKPANIVVEVTERSLLNVDIAKQFMKDIRAMGIRVAIDDFGTGYSSLSYLTKFEFDYLKIDKTFVDTIGTDAATSHVVPHIIEMAKALNLKMVAEGVETEIQAQYLLERGVQYAQGWLFGKPMPAGELAEQIDVAEPVVMRSAAGVSTTAL